ncbi:MAG: hypothetical protein Q8M40_06765 [Legionella sp.]|nr:hypothetical protein [Legionella sp.]
MNNKEHRFTTELFTNKDQAERAYQHAINQGYSDKDINVLMSEESRTKYYDSPLVKEEGTKSTEGLAIGGATGGAIGGIVAAIAALGTSLVIPGLGLVVAGPLAAGLAGVGAGSIAGGLLGALIGWGIPEEKAKVYESGIKSGGIVLGVNESNPNINLERDWQQYKN